MSPKHEGEEQGREVFVGGLSQVTDEYTLKHYFEHYGDIVECRIKTDHENRSRGFGFLLFNDTLTVDKIMADKKDGHIFWLDNYSIRVQRALPKFPRESAELPHSGLLSCKRVFVHGLPKHGITEKDVRKYFERFGLVKEVLLKEDRETGVLRGFAFVTFDDERCADKCLQQRIHEICNRLCTAKKAEGRRREQRHSRGRCDKENYHRQNDKDTCPMDRNDLNRLPQQQFSMRQPSMHHQATTPLAPAPTMSSSALCELAELLQASGTVLRSYLNQCEIQQPAADSSTTFMPYSTYSSRASNYGPSKDGYSTRRAKRTYRPYSTRVGSQSSGSGYRTRDEQYSIKPSKRVFESF